MHSVHGPRGRSGLRGRLVCGCGDAAPAEFARRTCPQQTGFKTRGAPSTAGRHHAAPAALDSRSLASKTLRRQCGWEGDAWVEATAVRDAWARQLSRGSGLAMPGALARYARLPSRALVGRSAQRRWRSLRLQYAALPRTATTHFLTMACSSMMKARIMRERVHLRRGREDGEGVRRWGGRRGAKGVSAAEVAGGTRSDANRVLAERRRCSATRRARVVSTRHRQATRTAAANQSTRARKRQRRRRWPRRRHARRQQA